MIGKMTGMRRGAVVGALILLGAPGLHAQTAPEPAAAGGKSVAQLNEEGTAFYQQRDYRHAIERFIQAFAIDPDPNLLFNIARSYERLGELDAAIEKYEQFLNTPGADASGRSRAQESLRQLRESKQGASAAPEAEAGGANEAAPLEAAPPPGADDGEPGGPSALPWVVLGGGIAFTTVGVSLYLLGASDHNKVTDARGFGQDDAVVPMTRSEAQDLVSSGDTKKLLGGIGLGLGGALLTTYVVMLATGSSGGEHEVAFGVAPAAGGANMSLTGSF
jgi:tetratricopeptide (TPR) repeat protein